MNKLLCLLTAAAVVCLPHALRAQQAGSLDPSFDAGSGPDGPIYALCVQADGKILVGGRFFHFAGVPCDKLVRLNPDGSLDTNFHPPAIGGANDNGTVSVNSLAVQPSGNILVGGYFGKVDGEGHSRLARLASDGHLDHNFSPDFEVDPDVERLGSGTVDAILVQPDGKILVAGAFDSVNGRTRRGVARLGPNGGTDADFNPGTLGGDVLSMALGRQGEIYIGGYFSTVGGLPVPAVAQLDAHTGAVNLGFAVPFTADDLVTALAVQPDGRLLVAGFFAQPGTTDGAQRGDVARLNPDGSFDATFTKKHKNGTSAFSSVAALLVQADGSILAAGNQVYAGGQGLSGVGRFLSSGKPDPTFFSGIDKPALTDDAPLGVADLKAVVQRADGVIVVAGSLESVDGVPRHSLAGLRFKPTVDCPVVDVKANQPLATIGGKPGVFLFTNTSILAQAGEPGFALSYKVSGAGTSAVRSSSLPGTLDFAAGTLKVKLKVRPADYADVSPGLNQPIKLTVLAGRGYTLGKDTSAEVTVVAGN